MSARLAPLAAALCLVLLVEAPARGQVPGLEERAPERVSFESPQHFWFEFKVGPYIPGIDSEFDGRATPYQDLFGYPEGDGRNVMFSLELDYELLRRFGTLAVGGSIGYFTNSASALWDRPEQGGVTPASGERSGSESRVSLLPLAVLAVYRFDLLADRFHIPLVPYLKFGLNYTFWWMMLDGETRQFSRPDGTVLDGKGGTFGWQLNAGAALRLDFIDPGSARALDEDIGINHSYLFFELAHLAADGLGSGSALGVGDTSWCGGLAFEF